MKSAEPLVLLIEDEPQVRRFLRSVLPTHGYRLLEAATAIEGEHMASSHNPELVLLDLGLPDVDGLEVVRHLREWSRAPIIIISARDREDDKVRSLDEGADDYLTKPFGTNELLARMRVALRHAQARGRGEANETYSFGALRVDLVRRQVTIDDREVHLTRTEYRLLAFLVENAGRVVTHGQLLAEVWGPSHQAETQYLRVYMGQLRRKIERDPNRPKILMTETGVGYRLRESE